MCKQLDILQTLRIIHEKTATMAFGTLGEISFLRLETEQIILLVMLPDSTLNWVSTFLRVLVPINIEQVISHHVQAIVSVWFLHNELYV